MKTSIIVGCLAVAALAQSAPAQQNRTVAPTQKPVMEQAPKLIVAISIDQFSADLFAEYRNHFTGGFARLLGGAVFPSGYQSHALTETCPGHSTLMTGMRPSHTGIIANDWLNLASPLEDKKIYCVEDESVAGSTHSHYSVTPTHLLVPTLGERMKVANRNSRNVAVSGKDRAAVMMGGHQVDQIWWWGVDGFVSYTGRTMPEVVKQANTAIVAEIGETQPPLELPDYCLSRARPLAVKPGLTVGDGRFARQAGDVRAFKASPEIDGATLAVAAGLVEAMKLGQGSAPDLLNISLSATDFVGHAYGTQGAEMCLELASLDRDLGDFFTMLDSTGVDYAVVLSADHGGIDLPERLNQQAVPAAQRIDSAFNPAGLSQRIASRLGLKGTPLHYSQSNFYVDPGLSKELHDAVLREAKAMLLAESDVAAVFTAAEIEAAPDPVGPPETWPLIERAKASFYRPRSGDLVVALKPRVSPIAAPRSGAVATHGSFWDYDRRVPILFWRKDGHAFEQPLSVETVDIVPTLAGLLHLPLGAPKMDGRCLDLDPGVLSTCR